MNKKLSDVKKIYLEKKPVGLKKRILIILKKNKYQFNEGLDTDVIINMLPCPIEEIDKSLNELIKESKIYYPIPGKIKMC